MASEEADIEIFKDKQLGSGAFGMVCKAKYNLLPCAAKLLHPTLMVPGDWIEEKFMQECSFLASLKHPHIVQFLGVHSDPSTGQPALFTELMDESLTSLLKRHKSSNQLVPLHTQTDISHDVCLALHYLHTKGIIHRDLSSNNILLIGGSRAKITDFGMSKLTLNVSTPLSSLTQVPGCPVYMPPEAWVTPPIYTEKLDVFSFGVILLQLATCEQPNPGPLETLIPDERSPTGFLKLPVPETRRRGNHLDQVPDTHPMKELVISCFSDKQDSRPSSRELCGFLETIKESNVLTHYKIEEAVNTSTSLSADITVSSKAIDSNDAGSASIISKTRDEIESLRKALSENESELTRLHTELTTKDNNIETLYKELEELKSSAVKQKDKESSRASSTDVLMDSVEKRTIDNLSSELLFLLQKDPHFSQAFNGHYERHNVTFHFHSKTERYGETRVRLFLQMYQQLFNTGQIRISFVPIPESFPKEHLSHLVTSCSQHHNQCSFELMEEFEMVKVVSRSPPLHNLSVQLVTDLLHLFITLPGGRKMSLKISEVFDQEADVLVCSATPKLVLFRGMSMTFNVKSNFELENHCKQYVERHGFLKPGQIMLAPSSGSLPCKWVIFAVGPDVSYSTDETSIVEAAIASVMNNLTVTILDKADKLKAESLAIPLLGPVSLDQKISTRIMAEKILEHKYHSLKEIHLCIYKERFIPDTIEVLMELGAFWTKKEYDSINSKINTHKSCKQQ